MNAASSGGRYARMNFTTPPSLSKSPEYQVKILDRVSVDVVWSRLAPVVSIQ